VLRALSVSIYGLIETTLLGVGMVVYTYNPSYSGPEIRMTVVGGQPSKKISETPISTNKLSVMVSVYNSSYAGGCR
jgi:hypothetical protein